MSIAVCDDMPIECVWLAVQIENILKDFGTEFSLKRFFDGQELLKEVESFDIIFLDIKMPGISGMELAGQMRENGSESIIVFVTSAEEYVYEAYDVEAFHFLLKPVDEDKLKNVLKKAAVKVTACNNKDFLIITSEHRIKKILLKDIFYIESVGRTVKIHCNNGVIEAYKQIGDLEQTLSDKHFFRCHKSFLLNLEYVSRFDKAEIVMENGDTVFLARKRAKIFQQEIISYMKMKGGIL
ncbi:MAG: LytTR family DNA-binding domain-containing protein [Oscillospiraceae bacterium]|nr:LytTR family DNA-binding domain-containing protein [Oscillospiraceae bacterium]